MSDKRWKRIEREKCAALGGKRTGPRGYGLPDCTGLHVALEVKSYKRFVFLTKDWEQAVENAERVGLPAVLAVKERGKGRDCVQMRECHYADLLIAGGRSPHPFSVANPEPLRVSWGNFVRLYRDAYNFYNEENIG
jgi:hypothetical protein